MDKSQIITALKDEIKDRDNAKLKVERLVKAQRDNEEKANDLSRKIETETAHVADLIGEGEDPMKAQGKLQGLRGRLTETEGLITEIKNNTLLAAKQDLKIKQQRLEVKVKTEVQAIRAAAEEGMNDLIDQAMDEYDRFNDFLRDLYQDLAVTMIVGTMDEVPKVKNERFTRYFQNVGA